MNNLVFLGYITGTHGIKGELKVKSDFEYKNRVFNKGFNIIIDDEKHTITSYRPHKQFDLITIDNVLDINDIYKYVGKDIFITKEDLKLNTNEYLYQDLVGLKIIENNKEYGCVKEIRTSNIILLKIDGEKEFYIPFIDEYIKKVDLENKSIYTKGVEELIL